MVISASLQACGVVFPLAMLTSICRSIVTICSGLYLLIGMTRFSSKWILSHSTWYKVCRSGQDKSARAFVPREEDLKKSIQQNDFVMFHFCRAEPGQPTCFILGQHGDKVEFDSRRLRTQQAFTHFFLTAGEHSYHMGRGSYRVSVTD